MASPAWIRPVQLFDTVDVCLLNGSILRGELTNTRYRIDADGSGVGESIELNYRKLIPWHSVLWLSTLSNPPEEPEDLEIFRELEKRKKEPPSLEELERRLKEHEPTIQRLREEYG